MDTDNRRSSLEAAGRWLREQRERHGFKAGAFARTLNIDPSQLSRYERGMAAVSDDRAAQIADVLGLSETETRRGLRRWVPDNVNEAHESDPLHGDYPAELTEHERSLWDRMHPMDADARMRVIHYVRYEMSHQRGRQSA